MKMLKYLIIKKTKKMEIKHNTEIEVTKQSQQAIMARFGGVVAHREENGKYYIKIMLKSYIKYIAAYIAFPE